MQLLQSLLFALAALLSLTSAYTTLTDGSLTNLSSPGDDFDIKTGALLAPILVPRVPGSKGSTAVLNHFVSFFRDKLPKWNLEFQNSTQVTAASNGELVPFKNLIATRDPPWARPGEVGRLALVAHYDSKMTPEGFIGATDSAAPCAMLMHAARSIDEALTKKWESMQTEGVDEFGGVEEEKGVQIILLDGEEAFISWTETDSLYGARSLAEAWEQTPHPAMSTFHNQISSIDLFVLLDLLGSKNPRVPSYFMTTHWAYQAMAKLEKRLRELGHFKSQQSKRDNDGVEKRAEAQFLPESDKDNGRFLGGMVEDDHIPFMARGVEILHIIPTPFPRVWHTMADDGEHLDIPTVEDWAMLVTAFASEWMDLEGFLGTGNAPSAEQHAAGAKGKRTVIVDKSELGL
ncbi:hypothetical protein K402DRAFT_397410 [Aulographum hederae CBS 113979]|uniref:Peptide hydrolase n=1 Tax=Aulographum hederae CBS 113979 TaxID=1176131 RepID=A0A6G1GP18_9PEZI|nr:hypothetical protein K402DRAFT_397410 [Aulographum hederae CBS 113979]